MGRRKRRGKKRRKGKRKKKVKKAPRPEEPWYIETLTELNRKLSKLREVNQILVLKNDALAAKANEKIDDRSIVCDYFTRLTEEAEVQIEEIRLEIIEIQKIFDLETVAFDEKIELVEEEYLHMRETLQSDKKALNTSLNALDKFASDRNDLMSKFEIQEAEKERLEKEHAQKVYEMECYYIKTKNALMKDMEQHLKQLADDLHEVAEVCIMDVTQNTIRYNIKLNNELDDVMEGHTKLYDQSMRFRSNDLSYKLKCELYIERRKMLVKQMNQYRWQINKVTVHIDTLQDKVKDAEAARLEAICIRQKYTVLAASIEDLDSELNIVKQRTVLCERETKAILKSMAQETAEKQKMYEIINYALLVVDGIHRTMCRLGACPDEGKGDGEETDKQKCRCFKGTDKQVKCRCFKGAAREGRNIADDRERIKLLETLKTLLQRARDPNFIRVASVDTAQSLHAICSLVGLDSVIVASVGSLLARRFTKRKSRFRSAKRRTTVKHLPVDVEAESGESRPSLSVVSSIICSVDFAAQVDITSLEIATPSEVSETADGLPFILRRPLTPQYGEEGFGEGYDEDALMGYEYIDFGALEYGEEHDLEDEPGEEIAPVILPAGAYVPIEDAQDEEGPPVE